MLTANFLFIQINEIRGLRESVNSTSKIDRELLSGLPEQVFSFEDNLQYRIAIDGDSQPVIFPNSIYYPNSFAPVADYVGIAVLWHYSEHRTSGQLQKLSGCNLGNFCSMYSDLQEVHPKIDVYSRVQSIYGPLSKISKISPNLSDTEDSQILRNYLRAKNVKTILATKEPTRHQLGLLGDAWNLTKGDNGLIILSNS